MESPVSHPSASCCQLNGAEIDVAWDAFVDLSPQGVIYCRSWWLDVVAPGRWELLTVRKGGKIRAGWPLVWAEEGRRRIVMPPLTQRLGILLSPAGAKYAEELGGQQRLTEELIESLPAGSVMNQNFSENFASWLPFYWHGYQQTTRYSYIIKDLSDVNAIWSEVCSKRRGEVRKAQKLGLRVSDTDDLERFHRVNTGTFARQGMEPPYSLEFVQKVDDACRANAGRKILLAEGADGRAHAGVYLVYDSQYTILLLSGSDEELRSSGAGSLVTWEAIRFAATVSRQFDFEGSMIRPIEHFYRDFGGRQTPYSRIWGTGAKPLGSGPRRWVGRVLRKAARVIDP